MNNMQESNGHGYKQPLSYAILIHVMALSVLLFQFSFSRPSEDFGLHLGENIIEATIVSQSTLDASDAKKAAEQRLIVEQAVAEEKRIEDQKNAETKKIADAKAAEKKRIAGKAAAEKAKLAAAEKKKTEAAAAEAKKVADAKAAEQTAREQALQQQLATEAQAQQSAAAQRLIASEVDKYKLLVKQKVMQNWLIQAGFQGLSCQLDVRLAASGTVLDVRVIQSSGDDAFDRSAIMAVQKAAPLPVPPTPQAFAQFREIRLTLRPE